MIFTHADDAISPAVNHTVSISNVSLRGNRVWLSPGPLTIDSLVNEVRKVDRSISDDERSSAVLVNSRANVEGRRRHIDCSPVRCPTYDDVSSTFSRAHLDPVYILAVECDLPKLYSFGDDKLRGDWRPPRAIRCYFLSHFPLNTSIVLNWS